MCGLIRLSIPDNFILPEALIALVLTLFIGYTGAVNTLNVSMKLSSHGGAGKFILTYIDVIFMRFVKVINSQAT